MACDPPRLLVFQHIPIEHPGIFREFLAADGIAWTTVELDRGEAIPDLGGFDALWVMGGPMDVWQETEHPWLAAEKAAIREAVAVRGLPFLGVCLGHQLMAEALGGRVAPMTTPEVGILEVALTDEGRVDPLMAGMAEPLRCLQWHGAEVVEAPPGASVLAASPASRVQALAWGGHAWSLQFHVELTAETVGEWGRVPAYGAALERTLGPGALAALDAGAGRNMSRFNAVSRRLYDNFMRAIGGGA